MGLTKLQTLKAEKGSSATAIRKEAKLNIFALFHLKFHFLDFDLTSLSLVSRNKPALDIRLSFPFSLSTFLENTQALIKNKAK
jgi:hypothetical protein